MVHLPLLSSYQHMHMQGPTPGGPSAGPAQETRAPGVIARSSTHRADLNGPKHRWGRRITLRDLEGDICFRKIAFLVHILARILTSIRCGYMPPHHEFSSNRHIGLRYSASDYSPHQPTRTKLSYILHTGPGVNTGCRHGRPALPCSKYRHSRLVAAATPVLRALFLTKTQAA